MSDRTRPTRSIRVLSLLSVALLPVLVLPSCAGPDKTAQLATEHVGSDDGAQGEAAAEGPSGEVAADEVAPEEAAAEDPSREPAAMGRGPDGVGVGVAWTKLLEDLPCGSQSAALLTSWGAKDDARPAPPVRGLARRYRIPTQAFGDWVLLDIQRAGAPTATRVRPGGAERHSFDADCVPMTSTSSFGDQEPNADGSPRAVFTDADLRARVEETGGADNTVAGGPPATVVYVWSPHMPLSVDGYREILLACEALGLGLIPVLFPGGDPAFAASEAERAGIPKEGLREIASIELTFRDAQVHAPTVLVFHGHRVSATLPGYRNAKGYERFLEDFLQTAPTTQ